MKHAVLFLSNEAVDIPNILKHVTRDNTPYSERIILFNRRVNIRLTFFQIYNTYLGL